MIAARLRCRDPASVRFVVLRYLPWFFALNLAWEAAQVRLYTLWMEAAPRLSLGDFELGITPLLQWLVIPPSPYSQACRGSERSDDVAKIGMSPLA